MNVMTTQYPEPPLPPGKSGASRWYRLSEILMVAAMLDLTEYTKGDNLNIATILGKMMAAGKVQYWKQGPGQTSPAYYRLVW
jgi:hypothetical protein